MIQHLSVCVLHILSHPLQLSQGALHADHQFVEAFYFLKQHHCRRGNVYADVFTNHVHVE